MEEVRQLTEFVRKMSPTVELCFGVARDKTLIDKIKVILVATESAKG